MNIAFPAIFFFLLALPGIIFRYSYRKGNWKAPISTKPIPEEIAYSLVFALALHVLWCFLTGLLLKIFHLEINLNSIYLLVVGSFGHDSKYFDLVRLSIIKPPFTFLIFLYFITIFIISGLGGYYSHKLVRKKGWDLSNKLIRFNNDWYYLLIGDIVDFKENKDKENHKFTREEIDGTLLSTIVIQGNEVFLYKGIVEDFFFDKDGTLDRIMLSDVKRKKLSDKLNNEQTLVDRKDGHYHIVRGDYFVILYSQMRTLNVEYILIDPINRELTEEEKMIVKDLDEIDLPIGEIDD
ncbi:MAG: hypothetical protein WAR79_14000 [Melioribacteraceae bacterium]